MMKKKSINYSLLLIEDDQVDEMAILRVLAKEEQYSVTVAHTLNEARRILNERYFDLVITDYDLPDGYASELEDQLINKIVIFITGAGSEEIAALAFKLGVSDYLIKDNERNYLKLLPRRLDAVIQQKKLSFQLNERLKEMKCLYAIRHALDLNHSIEDISTVIIESLPASMQFPEFASVLIKFDDKQFASVGFDAVATPKLSSNIQVNGEVCGQLSVRYTEMNLFFLPEEQNLIDVIARDIGWWLERKKNDENLRIAAVALESSQGIIITDSTGKILRYNTAFEKILHCNNSVEICGNHFTMIKFGDQHNQLLVSIWELIEKNGNWAGEITFKHEMSYITLNLVVNAVKNSLNELSHYVGVFQDTTKAKSDEREIHALKYYNPLTNLPNRDLLINYLDRAILSSNDTGKYNAILLIDIDHLKSLNDLFGDDEGDRLLVEIGNCLRSYANVYDTVAHLGGDEFVVLLDGLDKSRKKASIKAEKTASKILNQLNLFKIGDTEYRYRLKIGIHIFSGHDSSDNVIKSVNAAMHQAKHLHRNINFYDADLYQLTQEQIILEIELHQALKGNQLQLYYQIQVNDHGETVGAEALIRWNHPERGLIPPLKFISIAEESSLILEIGQWIIDTACEQLSAWSKCANTKRLSLAINISHRQFYDEGFVAGIATAIQSYSIDPALLKLEFTESIVMDKTIANEKIAALRKLGVQLSLDDFGTGYSSLSYLRQLNVDQLKIDQSFVRCISKKSLDGIVAKTIIDLAHNFHLNVISEGVETEYQLAFLKENGCKAFQGYLFAKPLPIKDMELLLDKYPQATDKSLSNIIELHKH